MLSSYISNLRDLTPIANSYHSSQLAAQVSRSREENGAVQEPGVHASPKERIDFCERMQAFIERELKNNPGTYDAQPDLAKIARQLKHLPAEKSLGRKIGEQAIVAVLDPYGINSLILSGIHGVSPNEVVRRATETPQRKSFRFLKPYLALTVPGTAPKPTVTVKIGPKKFAFTRPGARNGDTPGMSPAAAAAAAAAASSSLSRIKARAPLWTEMMAQLPGLKPDRQQWLVNKFQAMFKSLSESGHVSEAQRQGVVGAYNETFIQLLNTLPNAISASKEDGLPDTVRPLILCIREQIARMSGQDRKALSKAVRKAVDELKSDTTDSGFEALKLATELAHLQSDLDAPSLDNH